MKRVLVLIAVLASAAGNAAVIPEPLKVIYMAQAGYDPRDVELRGKEFTRETGIGVQFRFEEYEDIYELLTGEEGKSGEFDIVLLDNIWTADFADRGILEPVPRKIINKIESDIIPEIYSANMYAGRMWAVPFLANFQLLYTNMDLLRKAGYSEPPVTLDQMMDMAGAAKDKGIIEYPIFDSLRSEEVLVCELIWLSSAFGNNWETAGGHLVIDRRENREAVEYLLELKKKGLLNPYSLKSGEVFAAEVFLWGDALFTTNWTFLIGKLRRTAEGDRSAPGFEARVSVLPVSQEGRKSSTVSGFQGLAVMKNSARKEMAWQFITYLSSPDFQRRHLDEFPVWKSLWLEDETALKDKYFDIKKQQVEGARVRPAHPDYQAVSGIIRKWVYDALNENVTLDYAFRMMQKEIDRLQL